MQLLAFKMKKVKNNTFNWGNDVDQLKGFTANYILKTFC